MLTLPMTLNDPNHPKSPFWWKFEPFLIFRMDEGSHFKFGVQVDRGEYHGCEW